MQTGKLNVYESIVNDVKRKISLGLLREGERLASCREYALLKGINPNTVQRAYSELESEGFIYTIPKKGVYVAPVDKGLQLKKVAKEKLSELKASGLNKEQLTEILDEIYGDNDD